jgi:1,4-alpha-glucan branching enzyme
MSSIEALVAGTNHDPFTVLGVHQVGEGEWQITTYQPDAESIEIHFPGRKQPVKMKRIHPAGVFRAKVKRRSKPIYHYQISSSSGHQWQSRDAYTFLPVLTEYDLHLFNEGNHFRIYEKLGAHLMEHEGVHGAHFAVWAPNARRVSLVGDFNYWDGRRHPMRVLGASGVWEIFIPDIKAGEKYKYEILGENNDLLLKADPYGQYMEKRPQTASIVHPSGTYQWQDESYMQRRRQTNPLLQATSIYEVHLGSWKRVPEEDNRFLTYRELADDLIPYVCDLGYTHIELMPVAEHPFDGSWGYQVVGYYAPTSRFGTPEDFAYFVDRCHQENIGVIIDWVPAHFPMDDHGLRRFDGTALYEHDDPRRGYHMDWKTLIFNYGRNEVRNFLIANALYWLEVFHIDGLRVDAVSSMLYLDYSREPGEWIPNQYGGRENIEAIQFIQKLNQVVHHYYPGVLTIAEESTSWPAVSRPVDSGGLGFNMKWNMGWMNDYLQYIEKDPIYRRYHHNELTFSRIYAYTENFILILSHDEVVHGKRALNAKMPGDDWQKFATTRLTLAYMAVHPGKQLTFMGMEFGQWHEWSEAQSLDWHLLQYTPHQQLQTMVRELNRLYRNEGALWQDDFSEAGFAWVNCTTADHSLLAFLRYGENREKPLLVIVNFTPTTHREYHFGVPRSGYWQEIFNTDAEHYGGSNQGNLGGVHSENISWDGYPHRLPLTVPPLAVLVLRCVD